MKSKAIQRWMARGGKVKGYASGGMIQDSSTPGEYSFESDDEYDKHGHYKSGGGMSMSSLLSMGKPQQPPIDMSVLHPAKNMDFGEKATGFASRWADKKIEGALGLNKGGKVRKYATGGEVEQLGLPAMLADDDEEYSGSSKKVKSSGGFGNFEKDYSGSDRISGMNSFFKMNQGGFVNRLPYSYQDESDFGASGVDTNYGEWEEEEDEQEQPAGITISFASALQKRKKK